MAGAIVLHKEKRNNILNIYAYTVCLYTLAAADVLWIEKIPINIIYIFTSWIFGIKIVRDKKHIDDGSIKICLPILLYCVLTVLLWTNHNKQLYAIILPPLSLFLMSFSMMLLPIEEKERVLNVLSKCLTMIVVLTVPAWFLFLAGYELPHSDVIVHPNGFHQYYDYHFFRLTALRTDIFDLILPRFSSIFLEPGQFATPYVFFFYLNGAKLSKKNIPFIIAILLSFSLIAVGLMAFAFFSKIILDNKRYLLLLSALLLSLLGGIYYYSQNYLDEDNPLKMHIFNRLEYDSELGIVGNNRTSYAFDIRYDRYMQSSDKWLGIADKLFENTSKDWTVGASGYKKFIVHRGLFGFCLFMSFIFALYYKNKCLPSFLYFSILTLAFLVRNLLQSPLWLSIAILGMYVLKYRNKETKKELPNHY